MPPGGTAGPSATLRFGRDDKGRAVQPRDLQFFLPSGGLAGQGATQDQFKRLLLCFVFCVG
jgi:hypothetical protein